MAKGNWSIGGINLPELGITEKLGGKKASTQWQSPAKPAPTYNYSGSQSRSAPSSSMGSVAGASTYNPSPISGSGQKENVGKAEKESKKAAESARKALMAQIDAEYSDIMGQIGTEESRLGGMRSQLYCLYCSYHS